MDERIIIISETKVVRSYLILHGKRNIKVTSVFAFLIQSRYKNKGQSISSEVTKTNSLLEYKEDGNGFENHSHLNTNVAATSTLEMDPPKSTHNLLHTNNC